MSRDKTSVQAADDIKRRFLPEYEKEFAEAVEHTADLWAAQERRTDFLLTITSTLLGGAGSVRDEATYRYTVPLPDGGWIDLRYAGYSSAQVSCRSIRPDLAIAIAQAVQQFVETERAKLQGESNG